MGTPKGYNGDNARGESRVSDRSRFGRPIQHGILSKYKDAAVYKELSFECNYVAWNRELYLVTDNPTDPWGDPISREDAESILSKLTYFDHKDLKTSEKGEMEAMGFLHQYMKAFGPDYRNCQEVAK